MTTVHRPMHGFMIMCVIAGALSNAALGSGEIVVTAPGPGGLFHVGDTNRDKVGDLWLANGEGPGGAVGMDRSYEIRLSARPAVSMLRDRISITAPGSIHARLLDPAGRSVAESVAHGQASVDIRSVNAGTYILTISAGGRTGVRQVVVE